MISGRRAKTLVFGFFLLASCGEEGSEVSQPQGKTFQLEIRNLGVVDYLEFEDSRWKRKIVEQPEGRIILSEEGDLVKRSRDRFTLRKFSSIFNYMNRVEEAEFCSEPSFTDLKLFVVRSPGGMELLHDSEYGYIYSEKKP